MIVYADTSWWIAYTFSDDANHRAAVELFDSLSEPKVQWTPWQRVEVFNGLRQLERGGQIASGRAQEFIRILEHEVQLGYWPHVEFDWRRAVRAAVELSAAFGLQLPIRGMDLFHIAIALTVKTEALLTFDDDQAAFADAAGLRVVRITSS